jgi:hypothetical protein
MKRPAALLRHTLLMPALLKALLSLVCVWRLFSFLRGRQGILHPALAGPLSGPMPAEFPALLHALV